MRASGIILHITSLPSPHGVGTLGRGERVCRFPFGKPDRNTGRSCRSARPATATHRTRPTRPLPGTRISSTLKQLVEKRSPHARGSRCRFWSAATRRRRITARSTPDGSIFSAAPVSAAGTKRENVADFHRENESWLRSYALYTAAKRHFGMRPWIEWEDEDLRLRRSEQLLRRV